MEDQDQKWDGRTERREHCIDHCMVSKAAKNSVPRWIYITTITAAVTLAGIFAIVQRTSFREMEGHMEERISFLSDRNKVDINSFYRSIQDNKILLQDVHSELREIRKEQTNIEVKLGKIESKQDLVVQKIKLTE